MPILLLQAKSFVNTLWAFQVKIENFLVILAGMARAKDYLESFYKATCGILIKLNGYRLQCRIESF
jgi:hypothetical protein